MASMRCFAKLHVAVSQFKPCSQNKGCFGVLCFGLLSVSTPSSAQVKSEAADRMGDSSPIRVTVFASSTPQTTAAFTAASAEFGQLLAQQGGQLVFGGGNAGCMGAVFQGALKAGGKVHGITHRMFCKPGGSSLTEENVSSHTLVAHPEPASRCAQGVLTNRSWLLATLRPQSSSRLRLSRARTSPCANGASSTRETVLSPCPVGLAPSMRCDRERV